jgi:hypothetical protein
MNADQFRGRLAEFDGYIEEWAGRAIGSQWLSARQDESSDVTRASKIRRR